MTWGFPLTTFQTHDCVELKSEMRNCCRLFIASKCYHRPLCNAMLFTGVLQDLIDHQLEESNRNL